MTEEDQIYSRAAMEGWLYVDTLNNGKILKVDHDTHIFMPIGQI